MFFTLHMCCCNIGQLLKLSVHCNQHCWYSTVLTRAESLCVFIYIYIYIYIILWTPCYFWNVSNYIYIYILAGATACGGLTCFVLYTLAPSKSHITHLCNSCLKAPGAFVISKNVLALLWRCSGTVSIILLWQCSTHLVMTRGVVQNHARMVSLA